MRLNKKPTLGVIVGSRGFFPKHLADSGRKTILELLAKEGIDAVCLTLEDTLYGAVQTQNDAQKCADLFKSRRDDIDGVLLTLPNFGEERPIADTLRWSGLNVPVLVHAFPDTSDRMTIQDRRDSFCGKMSACNNLTQYGIDYTLTTLHTAPLPREFLFGSFQAKQRMFFGLAPDRQWLAFVQKMSRGPLCRSASPDQWRREATVFDPAGEFMIKYATRRAVLQEHAEKTGTVRSQ